MKRPDQSVFSAKVRSAAEAGSRYGRAAAQTTVRVGGIVLKTKLGQRVATGAITGAAIGAVLPFVSAIAGAVLGAGVLVFVKSITDKD